MRRSLFTEAQITGIFKQAEAGRMVTDLCRERGITQATFYRWRSKYGGMEVSDAGDGSSAKLAPSSDVPEQPKEGKSSERPQPPGREQLVELLGTHQGNVYAIARLLGLERRQIYRLMERYGINLSRHRAHNVKPPDPNTD